MFFGRSMTFFGENSSSHGGIKSCVVVPGSFRLHIVFPTDPCWKISSRVVSAHPEFVLASRFEIAGSVTEKLCCVVTVKGYWVAAIERLIIKESFASRG